MIVDCHTHIGKSIYGYGQTPAELLHRLDRLGIDRAVVCPEQPEEYHLEPANDEVAAAVRTYPDRFVGFCRVDPRRGKNAVRELERASTQLGLRGLFLHPWEEGYAVNLPIVFPVVERAMALGMPLMVAAGFPWVSHATQVGDLCRRYSEAQVIMTHGGQLNISGLAQADALTALRDNPNLCTEVSGMYRQDFIETVIAEMGAARVLFGSNCPRMSQEFELERIRALKVGEDDRQAVLGGNAARLLGLVK
jgi:predicted TIM-barrel fold metal-dependent hydrolase